MKLLAEELCRQVYPLLITDALRNPPVNCRPRYIQSLRDIVVVFNFGSIRFFSGLLVTRHGQREPQYLRRNHREPGRRAEQQHRHHEFEHHRAERRGRREADWQGLRERHRHGRRLGGDRRDQ